MWQRGGSRTCLLVFAKAPADGFGQGVADALDADAVEDLLEEPGDDQANRLSRVWHGMPAVRGYALMSPALILMVVALISPFLMLVGLSFTVENGGGGDWAFSLANYETFFRKAHYVRTLWRSIGISSLVALVTVLLAYPAAYFIAFHVKTNKMLWLILITLPFWTSYLLRVFAWKLILGFNGVVNSSLMWLGMIDRPLELDRKSVV